MQPLDDHDVEPLAVEPAVLFVDADFAKAAAIGRARGSRD